MWKMDMSYYDSTSRIYLINRQRDMTKNAREKRLILKLPRTLTK